MIREGKRRITIGTFDLAKGVGMLTIIAGHTLSVYGDSIPGIVFILSIFGQGIIPMFYMISGFGSKKMDSRKNLKKTTKELLLPMLWVAVFITVLFPIMHYTSFHWWTGAFSEMYKTVLGLLTGCKTSGTQLFGIELYESSAVWYLLALFVALNIMNIIWKIPDERGQLFCVCLCVLAGFGCKAADIWYFCLPNGLMAVGYVYLGGRLKKRKWLEKKCPLWQWTVLAAILLFGEGLNYFSSGQYAGSLFVNYLVTGCFGLIFIRITLWANQYNGKLLEPIRKIGRYSYYIMCIHSVEMSCIPWYLFAQKFTEHPYVDFCLQMVLRGTIIGIGCMCLNYIMKYRRQKRLNKIYVQC